MAGQLLENSPEAGWISKTDGNSDFGYTLGAGAEKGLGLRDPSAIEIILIRRVHHLPEYSGKVRGGHPSLLGSGG